MTFNRIVVLLGVLVSALAQNEFNGLVDEVLLEAEKSMIEEGKDKLQLPSFSHPLHESLWHINLNGEVIVKDAVVKNLSSVHRIGDVIPAYLDDGSLVVNGTFGLTNLEVSIGEFYFEFIGIKMNDTLSASCTKNAVYFEVKFVYDDQGNCSFNLNQVKVTSLGGFHINFKPSGFFNSMEGGVASVTLDAVSPIIKSTINAHLYPILNKQIQKLNLCKYLPF